MLVADAAAGAAAAAAAAAAAVFERNEKDVFAPGASIDTR